LTPDGLASDEQARDRGNRPERAEGDGFGAGGPLGLRGDLRALAELEADAFGDRLDVLALDGRHVGATVVELEAVPRPGDATVEHRPRQRRGRDDVGREAPDVVLDDLGVQQADPDDRCVDPFVEGHWLARGGGSRVRGEDPDRESLADMQPQCLGRELADHHLVGPLGVGHPALGDREPVLVEQRAVDAGPDRDVGRTRGRRAVGIEHARAQHHERPDARYVRQVCERVHDGRVVAVSGAGGVLRAQVGRIGALEEGGKGGLGSPAGRDACHRDATDDADQQQKRDVASPAAAERGPEAVPRDASNVHADAGSVASTPTAAKVVNRCGGVVLAPRRVTVRSWQLAAENRRRARPS
jgi:hypothetical protein